MRVIAHRGVSARFPENTIAAFEAAIDVADGIELDARLTADNIVVISHDDDLTRVAGVASRVSDMTFEQLRAAHSAVPTLQEVLALVGERLPVVVEIKGAFGGARTVLGSEVAEATLPLLQGVPRVVVSSFDPGAVEVVRAESEIPTAITIGRHTDLDETLAYAVKAGHAEIHLPGARADATFVSRAHDAGRAVLAYTVNDRDEARALEAMGVDGIFSDDPEAVRP